MTQLSLVRGNIGPEGFAYFSNFLTPEEEHQIICLAKTFELQPYVSHGQPSRRRVRSFGLAPTSGTYQTRKTTPWPSELEWLRRRAAELVSLGAGALIQGLISFYPQRSTIGWHRDAPVYGPTVVGISLLGACTMRFREFSDHRRVIAVPLVPRDAYVISASARSNWEHSIPPVPTERWSVTFRTAPT